MSSRSPYIVSPLYDWAFFLLPPVASLLLGIAFSWTDFFARPLTVAGETSSGGMVLIGIIVHAHLVAVFLRSHGNPQIRRLHPLRFVVIPILLWIAIVSSPWIAVASTVVATFWDVWHSGAQTFGFARIYDRNAGNPPEELRRLDFWLNQLLYAGPILAGATLAMHLDQLEDFDDVGFTLFCGVPALVEGRQRTLRGAIVVAGLVFLSYYIFRALAARRRGYRVSPYKIVLVTTTGACSIVSWAFNSWGEAFFAMNLFHAVQYLALVWASERRRWLAAFGLRGPATCAVYLGAVILYGVGAELVHVDFKLLWGVTMVVSLMHFWYDGFIWSVARRQI